MLKRSHRRRRGLIAAVLFALTGFFISSPAARADVDCTKANPGPHCYAEGIYQNPAGVTAVQATIRREQMGINRSVAGPDAHINSEFWFMLDDASQHSGRAEYLEAGIRQGDDSGGPGVNSSGGCNCYAYDLFWADHVLDSAGNDTEYRHVVNTVTADNQTIDYWQINRDPAQNHWQIKLNTYPTAPSTIVGYSTVEDSWTAVELDMGGEYAGTSCAGGNVVWAPGTDMWASLYDWAGWASVQWTSHSVTDGCGFSYGSPARGEWQWGINS